MKTLLAFGALIFSLCGCGGDSYAVPERHRPKTVMGKEYDNPKAWNCHVTFVTTYGVKRNKHSGIVQSEVTLDDLFRA